MTEHKQLWGRWLVIALVVGAAVGAFYSKRSKDKPYGVALGQDLKGGTTLRFSLDVDQARRENRVTEGESSQEIVEQTLLVIESRINKYGVAELNVTPVGEGKFEISLPAEMDAKAVTDLVAQLGKLEFRIVVKPSYGADDATERERKSVWEGSGAFAKGEEGFEGFKKKEIEVYEAARQNGTEYVPTDPGYRIVPYERAAGTPDSIAMQYAVIEEPKEKKYRFGGEILSNPRPDVNEKGQHVVLFGVKTDYQNVFGEWTGQNVKLPMAIILNEHVFTDPVINSKLTDNVEVTVGGGDVLDTSVFQSQKERAKSLATVLQTGSLKVKPRLESTSTVGPTLAGQAVRRGILSTAIAFGLVLLYMAIYYFAAGMIANVALLLNLVLLLGSLAFLDGALTLPGIAGIVLTLGMAVDANILVYERIREEQNRGKSVQRAVAEGFERAFTTIVDSNVTTFITALFLLSFGSGSIKGFAVTLILGLLASMFTAVYVTRTLFETWLARGKKTPIAMLGTGKAPNIRWMKLRRIFIPISIVAMGTSILIFAVSPRQTVYDIDFTGGMKLQARFSVPTSVDEVKKALDSGVRTVKVKIDVARGTEVGTKEVKAGPYGNAEVVTVGAGGAHQVEIRAPLTSDSDAATALTEAEQLDALSEYVRQSLADRVVPSWDRKVPVAYKKKVDEKTDPTGEKDPLAEFDGRLTLRVAIEDPLDALTADKLRDAIVTRMPYVRYDVQARRRTTYPAKMVSRKIVVKDVVEAPVAGAPPAAKSSVKTYDLWWKAETADGAAVENAGEPLLADLHAFLKTGAKDALKGMGVADASLEAFGPSDTFPTVDLIGAGVAERLRNDALLALLLSFIGIVIYVAFRFRSYAMGFAAVSCLVHDVLIALGVVCLVNIFGVVDARINLALVAAFLTIVGYSVNDTVVTFDRIRELRGKAPTITTQMIEDAVNQTFSRTLRTTLTVLLTVIVLFAMNWGQRSVLEGLSFCLLIGIMSGVYSTMGVAAPLLLFLPWFWAKARKYRPRVWALTWPSKKPYGWALLAVAAAVGIAVAIGHSVSRGAFYGIVAVPLVATLGFWMLWATVFGIGSFISASIMMIPWSFKDDPEKAIDDARREAGLPPAAVAV